MLACKETLKNQKNILKVIKRGNNEREKEQVTAQLLTIY